METYILEPGSVARKTIQELTEAATRGVDVRLIYDYVGSQKLKDKDVESLKIAGMSYTSFPLIRIRWTNNCLQSFD